MAPQLGQGRRGPGALVLLREHLLLALHSLETHSWKQLLLKLGHRWPGGMEQ